MAKLFTSAPNSCRHRPTSRLAPVPGEAVCPICFNAKQLDAAALIDGATLGGTAPMWEWIGEEGATTFSY